MRTTDTTPNNCWSCGREFDCASDLLGEKTPKPGNVSLCVECGAPGIFKEDLSTRQPTGEEMELILKSPEAVRYMAAIMTFHEANQAKCDG